MGALWIISQRRSTSGSLRMMVSIPAVRAAASATSGSTDDSRMMGTSSHAARKRPTSFDAVHARHVVIDNGAHDVAKVAILQAIGAGGVGFDMNPLLAQQER